VKPPTTGYNSGAGPKFACPFSGRPVSLGHTGVFQPTGAIAAEKGPSLEGTLRARASRIGLGLQMLSRFLIYSIWKDHEYKSNAVFMYDKTLSVAFLENMGWPWIV
jgi:hypothetical protein